MLQFKSSHTDREPLKFVDSKCLFSPKTSSATLFKNLLSTSAAKTPESWKSPISTWKKAEASAFPTRPDTSFNRTYFKKLIDLTDSLPLSSVQSNFEKQALSIETSRQTQNSNPNTISTDSMRKSTSSQMNSASQSKIYLAKDESPKMQELQLNINNLKHQLADALRKKDLFQKRLEEANQELISIKETSRQQSKKIVQATNINNQLEADLFVALNKLKDRQGSDSVISKQNQLKMLIVTLSQEKNELANKMSELLEQKARRENTQTYNKIEKAMTQNQLENARIEQLQQIQSLKSRINELEQQQNQNQKEYYEERIRLLEKEVKQLLLKCMSTNEVKVQVREERDRIQSGSGSDER